MDLTTQSGVNQDIAQAQQKGQQLQNQYDTQAQQYSGNYNADYGAATQAGQNLSNFANNMVNPADYYNQQLQSNFQQYGINPADVLKANQSLARTQQALSNAPEAAAQIGGGYGTTAGMVSAETANLQNKFNQQMVGQTGMVNAVSYTHLTLPTNREV